MRREFLLVSAVSAVAMIAATMVAQQQTAQHPNNPKVPNFVGEMIPEFSNSKRAMGKTGLQVSILGMGGFHLGTVAGQLEVNNMVAKALDHGINFFDNAWEYHKEMSEELLGKR